MLIVDNMISIVTFFVFSTHFIIFFGLLYNRQNLLILIICIEISYISLHFLIIALAIASGDFLYLDISFIILVLGAVDAAITLSYYISLNKVGVVKESHIRTVVDSRYRSSVPKATSLSDRSSS